MRQHLGTFDNQKELYTRMILEIMYCNRSKFNITDTNELNILMLHNAVNDLFDVKMSPKWPNILVHEYPLVFKLIYKDSSTFFYVNEDNADTLINSIYS